MQRRFRETSSNDYEGGLSCAPHKPATRGISSGPGPATKSRTHTMDTFSPTLAWTSSTPSSITKVTPRPIQRNPYCPNSNRGKNRCERRRILRHSHSGIRYQRGLRILRSSYILVGDLRFRYALGRRWLHSLRWERWRRPGRR